MSRSLFTSLIFGLVFQASASACSMYKISVDGKTVVGNNEDSWRLTSQIWFEPGAGRCYGAAYVGYSDKAFPEGGMNERGLVFDGFTVPRRQLKDQSRKITLPAGFDLRFVLQTCRNVDEAYTLLQAHNLNALNGGMYLFVDSLGNYLTVEADTLIRGNDPTYVLANFCPSQTPDLSAIRMPRYRNGVAFLQRKTATDAAFCTALSDTMRVCREGLGDGTLYTSIYDTQAGTVRLYFYHDYGQSVLFDLKEELAKGPHTAAMPDLFAPNAEYRRLSRYRTPQSSRGMLLFVAACAALLAFSVPALPVDFFRRKKNRLSAFWILAAAGNLFLLRYLWLLWRNPSILYLPAPYRSADGNIDPVAYLPLLAPLLLFGAGYVFWRNRREVEQLRLRPGLFILLAITYLALTLLFAYWGLFAFV